LEDLISINEEAIDKLVLNLYDYSERINNILNQINDLMNYSSTYFKGQQSNEIIKKYNDLQTSIVNVKQNISSYPADLIKVKNRFRNTASNISMNVRRQTSNIQSD